MFGYGLCVVVEMWKSKGLKPKIGVIVKERKRGRECVSWIGIRGCEVTRAKE